VVTHQLHVERRTAKVRRREIDVLPLFHATNRPVCVCVCVGEFEWLCPGGYGYVRQTRGDKIEGTFVHLLDGAVRHAALALAVALSDGQLTERCVVLTATASSSPVTV